MKQLLPETSRCLLSGCSGIPDQRVLPSVETSLETSCPCLRSCEQSISSRSKAWVRMLLWDLRMVWQWIQIKLNSLISRLKWYKIYTGTYVGTHTHLHIHNVYVFVYLGMCVFVYVCMKEIYSALNLPLHPCCSSLSTQVRAPSVHWVHLSLSSIVPCCSFLLSLPPCLLLIQMLILKKQLSTTSSIPLHFCFVSDSGPLFWYHFVLEVHCIHSFTSRRAGALLIQPAWWPPLPPSTMLFT